MTPLEILLQVARKLDMLEIPYMLSGALATSYYGRPRSTHDIDLVAEVGEADADRLFEAFEEDFYISEEAVKEAVRRRAMFNLIHNETATKIDFWMLEETPFDRERFSRRVTEVLEGVPVCLSTPEDLVVLKLKWFKDTDVQKHFDDALGILEVQRHSLDMGYIHGWCASLSTASLLERLLEDAGFS